MKLLAFAGSSSIQSINLQLVKYTCAHYFKEHEVQYLDLNDYEMPVFSVDKEKAGYPQEAHRFLEEIKGCDAIVLSLAEHNRSYSAAFKNIFDWSSRIREKVFQNKPMLLMSTSPGRYGGGNVMATATKFFPQFGAEIIASFSLPQFREHFDQEKGVTDAALKSKYEEAINQFLEFLRS